MRYSLRSGERVLGHTELDIETITPTMRQGFIEPTPEGRPLLADATGVWRAMADRKRAQRARDGEKAVEDDELVDEAMRRREALNLELYDERGEVLACAFIRVHDLFDLNAGVVDDMSDTEEEQEAKFEIYLSSLSADDRAEALAQRAETEAEIEAIAADLLEERDEEQLLGSSWPPPPRDDPRWETMQYRLQVFLKFSFEDDSEFPGQSFTGSSE